MRLAHTVRARLVLFLAILGVAGIAFLASAAGCSTGGNALPPANEASTGPDAAGSIDIFAKPVSITIKVVDQDKSPVFGASAQVNGKVLSGTTASDGILKIKAPVTGSSFGLRVLAQGFVDNVQVIQTVGATEFNAAATLRRVGVTQTLNPKSGGQVGESDAGGGATFDPDSFVDADGGVVSGSVEVSVTVVKPGDVAAVGTFEINGQPDEVLQSLGVIVVTATTADGQPVKIAPGKTIKITLPANIPASDAGAPPGTLPAGTPLPPVWQQDSSKGGWNSTAKTFALEGNRWVAQVDSLATWNCDYPNRVTCVRGTAITPAGKPLGGAIVSGKMTGNAAGFLPATTVLNATTGTAGTFCMEVVPGSQLTLTIACPDGPSANVGPIGVTAPSGARCSGAGGGCGDLGSLEVCCKEDADCAAKVPAGQKCVSGRCVRLDSCVDRCCPGRDDSCTIPGAACLCDDYCITAGDCCPDFQKSCK